MSSSAELNLEQLRPRVKRVELPGNLHAHVTEVSGAMALRWAGLDDTERANLELVAVSLCDENGKRLLVSSINPLPEELEQGVERARELPANVFFGLTEEASQLNKLTDEGDTGN